MIKNQAWPAHITFSLMSVTDMTKSVHSAININPAEIDRLNFKSVAMSKIPVNNSTIGY